MLWRLVKIAQIGKKHLLTSQKNNSAGSPISVFHSGSAAQKFFKHRNLLKKVFVPAWWVLLSSVHLIKVRATISMRSPLCNFG
jgi:hypothetical protein